MKVYPLHTGDTKVPYGQFYGGCDPAWVGWRGIWRMLTDKSHYIVVPIHAYLIEHPDAGPILVDAGINRDMAHAHNEYYDHWLFRLTLDEDEYSLERDQELSAQLAHLGYTPADIRTVIVTHLHEDHLGELRSLTRAKIVLSQAAWNAKHLGLFSFRKWSPSLEGVADRVERITCSSGPLHNFDRSRDLLGDGSIVLLPTPGHADGQLSVLVRMADHPLLLVSDAMYTLRHLAVDQVRPIMLSRRMRAQQIDSVRRIQRLREALPELVIVPTHDHTAYQSRYLDPFLADGVMTGEERQAIVEYEAQLFEAEWRLRPEALPRFVPPADAGTVGGVADVTDS